MRAIHTSDPESIARSRRVQELCRELGQLLTLSLEQRRVIDRLLSQLEDVTHAAKAQLRPLARSAGAGGAGADRRGR